MMQSSNMSHTDKKEYNCGFSVEQNWFRYRAAAIIVEDGCVLFAGNEAEDYLYSIGGAVHMGETAEDAVKREVLEETGVSYEVDRLAVIHENFFAEQAGSLQGKSCHEVAFYFLMKPRGSKELHSNSYTQGVRETMHWIPIGELERYKAFPTFMKAYLQSEHKGIEHIVTDERVSPAASAAGENPPVSLRPFTDEMYHAYYKEYENDPELFLDRSDCKPFVYSPAWVEAYIRRQRERERVCLAIMVGDEMAGEIIFKNIEPGISATLGICMKNNAWKGKGYGTQAERLAVKYAFEGLNVPVLYADTILPNTRSQHVLEKLGFRYLRTEGDFKYYEIRRPDSR